MSPDSATPPQQKSGSGFTVPQEIEAKYPDLMVLIRSSESMNDEERQYWVNILPAMTPEQVQNLQDILQNEKRELAAIDAKYAGQSGTAAAGRNVQEIAKERSERSAARKSAEQKDETQDEADTEALLKQIEGQGEQKAP